MEEFKRIESAKKRIANLRKDLIFLRSNGYFIIEFSEDLMRIVIKGCLFDFNNLNALYIRPSYWRNDEDEVLSLVLEY